MRLIAGIEASKAIPFDRVLYALGIRHVGETVAKRIARAVGGIERLMAMDRKQLTAVDEVGEVIAESIADFFAVEGNRALVERLRAAGVRLEMDPGTAATASDRLAGQSIVVSGVFETFSRDGIKEAIERHGGKVSGSISKKTSFVVAGADMGPAKRQKADELGVKVIGEQEFRSMIGE